MKTPLISAFLLLWLGSSAQSKFEIDLNLCPKDELEVRYTFDKNPESDTLRFSFPATVPGTYDTQDYGRFITQFAAYNLDGKKMKVTKEGNNTWVIYNAKVLKHLTYSVEDVMDKKVKEHPIFQPASTHFIANKNFLFNNGGIFGFVEGKENEPLLIDIKKPKHLFGATSLPMISSSEIHQNFKARNYHQLIDCPMMFSEPDTAQFFVNSTKVTISVFDVQGKKRAKHFYQALKRDMEAIAKTLPALPVDNYTFIIFVDDLRELGKVLTGKKIGLLKKIKLALKYRNLGIGALEHGNSSSYYLGDFGDNIDLEEISLDGQLTGAAIHEFMHIITPLGLHSQYIGNFNYTHPVMSKHLWLYEGITEYFAHYVKFKGGVYTEDEFLKAMSEKFSSGVSFPVTEMSFTEMSAHVLEKKYHEHYGQVYQRGAALGMLLDGEIRKLSNGSKTLLDVVLELNSKYGAEKSFDEEKFFDEFTAAVHPDLRPFFTTYIEGKNQWKPNDQLGGMNVVYYDTLIEKGALSPLSPNENDVKIKMVNGGLIIKIESTGAAEWAGLQAGDMVEFTEYRKVFTDKITEGSTVKLPIYRKGKKSELDIKVKFGPKKKAHVLRKKQ